MSKINLVDSDVNPKSTQLPKKVAQPPPMGFRYGYPVPINIVLKGIVDRQFHINSQRIKGNNNE